MRNVWTVAKREFNMYFASPVAYAIGFGVLLVLGIFFYLGLVSGSPDLSQVLNVFVDSDAFPDASRDHAADRRRAAHGHHGTAADRAPA